MANISLHFHTEDHPVHIEEIVDAIAVLTGWTVASASMSGSNSKTNIERNGGE